MDGALVVYDANTLEEIKRIPMKKPSGKYNAYKIRSHAQPERVIERVPFKKASRLWLSRYHSSVPGNPLKGPTMSGVTQPP
jgi:hypothetical protein